jgi:predicted NUDIX family phosphoesterase
MGQEFARALPQSHIAIDPQIFLNSKPIMSTSEEKVLVVPTAVFHSLGYFQGFTAEVSRYFPALLTPETMSFRVRAEVENDPGFKQLIPYMFFSYTNGGGEISDEMSIFQYVRGRGMGESRLHSKRSIGVGGHISSDDLGLGHLGSEPLQDLYRVGMLRELHEEVELRSPYSEQCVGLINDDETEVGKVHLGIVHHFQLECPDLVSRETDLIESGFVPVRELLADLAGFESWSAICLTALFGR